MLLKRQEHKNLYTLVKTLVITLVTTLVITLVIKTLYQVFLDLLGFPQESTARIKVTFILAGHLVFFDTRPGFGAVLVLCWHR